MSELLVHAENDLNLVALYFEQEFKHFQDVFPGLAMKFRYLDQYGKNVVFETYRDHGFDTKMTITGVACTKCATEQLVYLGMYQDESKELFELVFRKNNQTFYKLKERGSELNKSSLFFFNRETADKGIIEAKERYKTLTGFKSVWKPEYIFSFYQTSRDYKGVDFRARQLTSSNLESDSV
jgi:uncharacterized lipoprotein YehR (DUF1307 family)